MKTNINKKILVALFILVLILVLFPVGWARAGSQAIAELGADGGLTFPDFNLFEFAADTILRIINIFLYAILYAATALFNVACDLVIGILNYGELLPNAGDTTHIVNIGWTKVLSVANMFFVIFLIITAFATILGIEQYNYRQVLWKLIVAALLINFSLVIAGVFIDFAQVLANSFLDGLSGYGIADQLSTALGLESIFVDTNNANDMTAAVNELDDGVTFGVNMTMTIVLSIIFILIAAFIMFVMAFMFLVRIITIWILLILSPIAWVMWVFPHPQIKGMWDKWWNKFLQQVFFAPIALFFVWLAIQAVDNNFITGFLYGAEPVDGSLMTKVTKVDFIMQFAVVIGLLIGAILVGQSVGAAGASFAMSTLKSSRAKIVGGAAKGARYVGGKAAETAGRYTGATAAKEKVQDYFISQKLIRQKESQIRSEDRAKRARGEAVPEESAYKRAQSAIQFDKMTKGLSSTEKLEQAALVSKKGGVAATEAKRIMAEADVETPEKAATARKVAEVMEGMKGKVAGDAAKQRLAAERSEIATAKKRKDLVEDWGEDSDRVKRFDAERMRLQGKKQTDAIKEMEETEKKGGHTLVMPTGDIVSGTGEMHKYYSPEQAHQDSEMKKEASMTKEEIEKKREAQMDIAKKEMLDDFQKRAPGQPDKEEIEWRGKQAGLSPDQIRDQVYTQRKRDIELTQDSKRNTAQREEHTAKLMEEAAKDMREAGKELKTAIEDSEYVPHAPPPMPIVKDNIVVRPTQTVENPEELPPEAPKPPTPPTS